MKKWFVAAAALILVLAIPAAYAAASSNEKTKPATQAQKAEKNAAKLCKAERTAMGVEAFQKKYGTNQNLRNAFGKCVSSKSEDDKDDKDEKDDDDTDDKSSGAAKACKSERASTGAEAFAKRYGTNHNLKNAFGKCVSGKSKSKDKDDKDDD